MLLEPENLGRSEPRQHCVTKLADGFLQAAQLLSNLVAFRDCRSIAPQFGRPYNLVVFVEWYEAMLLATNADGFDLTSRGFGLTQSTADRTGSGITPGMWMLFLGSRRQVGDQVVFLARGCEDFA